MAIATSLERKRRIRDERTQSALAAYSGLHKLTGTANQVINLAKHLDKEFEKFSTSSAKFAEPSSFVRTAVGAPFAISDLTPEEMVFLSKGDGELIARIGEVQHRAKNNEYIFREYGRLRSEFDVFLAENAEIIENNPDGSKGIEISGMAGRTAEMKQAQLNQLLAGLIESIEEDRISVVDVVKRFIDEARIEFGDLFPVKHFEFRDVS